MSPVPTYFGEQQAQVPGFFASEPWMEGDKGALWYSPMQPAFSEPAKAELGPYVAMQPVYFYAVPVQQPQLTEMQCVPQSPQGTVQMLPQQEPLHMQQMSPQQIWQPCHASSQPSHSSTCAERSEEEFESVAPIGVGDVYGLSRDAHGCRQVQHALENAGSDAERIEMAAELRTHVWELLRCPHGNFVLQKCIQTLPPHELQFIIDELRLAGVDKVARHRFGCRVVQRLLEHCPQQQLQPLTVEIQQDAFALSTHIYGHYVLQHVVEHGSASDTQAICTMLSHSLPWVASSMYGVELVGTALCHAAPEEQAALVRSLLSNPNLIARMASSRHGHVAARQALRLATEADRQVALAELAKEDANLRASRYGRVFSKFLDDCRRGEASK